MSKADEDEFREWLDSIEFIDEAGRIITPKLAPDNSPDPDGDRTQRDEPKR